MAILACHSQLTALKFDVSQSKWPIASHFGNANSMLHWNVLRISTDIWQEWGRGQKLSGGFMYSDNGHPRLPTHPLLSLRSRWLTLQPPNSELLLTPAVSSVYVCVIAKKEIICAPRLSRWYSDGKNLFWKGCVDISLWCYFCSLPVSSYDAGYYAFQTWGNAKCLTTYETKNLYVRVRERWSPISLCVMLLLPAFGALFSQTRRTIFPCQYHHGCRCYMRRGREEPNE